MQALHDAGFTHGSLNLATFLITSDGHACVRDFTLCKKIDLLAAAKPGQKKRLPIYASPEMLMGESIDQSADIYAFGCCLYEFLTGANPFGSREDPLYYNRQLREDPEIPAEFARERIAKAILCCMQKNPADRYQSMTELRNAIVHHFDTRALRRDLLGTAADTKQPIVDLTQYTNAVLRPSGGDEYEPKTIFSAQQKSSNLPVLIEVQASWAGENSPKQRRSIELISKVHHANVESIIEQGDNDDFAYCFVIEDIAREPLSKHLEKVGKLSPAQFRHIFSQVCEGLQAIHEAQIVHTTITSEGLLLSTDGKEQVVISDCFNCKDFNHDNQRSRQDSSEPEREVGHISPEGLKEQPRDVRHDIYGLGACMYRALVGHELFESPNLMEKASKHLTEAATIPGDVEAESKELAAIILKCLEKEPDARYKTAEEVQKALQN
jgi:serine/threonine protein kinase